MKSFRLVQISDCHLFAEPDRAGYGGIRPWYSLAEVLKLATQFTADALLFSGDISNDLSRHSYQHLQTLINQYCQGIPWHLIPGNHDDSNLMQTMFAPNMRWLQTPVEIGNWQLHGLDSQYRGTLGQVSAAQLADLQQRINASTKPYHLVAVHHHPLASDSWMDKHAWVNSEAFLKLLERNPSIRLVLHGHIHTDKTWQYASATIAACPSSCWQWAMQPEFALADERPGLRIIDLGDNGDIHSRVARLSLDSDI